MSNTIFHINEYINKFPLLDNLREELAKNNIQSKDYVEDNLCLFYHKFDKPSTTDIERECRSLVIDRTTLQVVSFSCETPLLNNELEIAISKVNTLQGSSSQDITLRAVALLITILRTTASQVRANYTV